MTKTWKKKQQQPSITCAKKLWNDYKVKYPNVAVAGGGKSLDNDGVELNGFEFYQRRNNVLSNKDDFIAFIDAPPRNLVAGSTAPSW